MHVNTSTLARIHTYRYIILNPYRELVIFQNDTTVYTEPPLTHFAILLKIRAPDNDSCPYRGYRVRMFPGIAVTNARGSISRRRHNALSRKSCEHLRFIGWDEAVQLQPIAVARWNGRDGRWLRVAEIVAAANHFLTFLELARDYWLLRSDFRHELILSAKVPKSFSTTTTIEKNFIFIISSIS